MQMMCVLKDVYLVQLSYDLSEIVLLREYFHDCEKVNALKPREVLCRLFKNPCSTVSYKSAPNYIPSTYNEAIGKSSSSNTSFAHYRATEEEILSQF